MWKALVCLGLVGGTAAARPSSGTVDGWRGPFESIDAATAADGSPTQALATLELPSGAPIDDLRTVRGTIVADGREVLPWHLVASTHAGWFISPALGVDQNHSQCWVNQDVRDDNVHVIGNRIAIVYTCDVGKWQSALKQFALLCGVDSTGRVGCGSAVILEMSIVHRGDKEHGTDTEYDTLACTPSFAHDTLTLAPGKPVMLGEPGAIRHVDRLGTCARPTHFDLGGRYTIGAPKRVMFDERGRWL